MATLRFLLCVALLVAVAQAAAVKPKKVESDSVEKVTDNYSNEQEESVEDHTSSVLDEPVHKITEADLNKAKVKLNEEYAKIEKTLSIKRQKINQTYSALFGDAFTMYDGKKAVDEVSGWMLLSGDKPSITMNLLECAAQKQHPIMKTLESLKDCRSHWPNEQHSIDSIKGLYSNELRKINDALYEQYLCSKSTCSESFTAATEVLVEREIPDSIKQMKIYDDVLTGLPYQMKLCYESVKTSYRQGDTINEYSLKKCALWKTRKQSIFCRYSPFKCAISKYLANLLPWNYRDD